MNKQKDPSSFTNSLKFQVLSWSFAGVSFSLSSPIDLVRFRMQVMPELMQMGRISFPYSGAVDCAKRIASNEGYRGFWKGNLANLMRVIPMETMVFALKEQLQKRFHYHHKLSGSQHVAMNSAIGVFSTLIIAFWLYPFEYVRQQIANRTDRKRVGIFQEMKRAIKQQGLFELYHGVNLLLIALLSFRGAYFGLYDSLKVRTKDESVRFFYCYVSMFTSIMITFPIDGVRRRKVTNRYYYSGVIQCVKSIYQKEGIRGFYHGWQTVWVQSIAWSGFFFLYDRLFTDYKQALDL